MAMKKSGIMSKMAQPTFNAAAYAVNGLLKAEVQELKDAFDVLDTNNSSKLEANGIPCPN